MTEQTTSKVDRGDLGSLERLASATLAVAATMAIVGNYVMDSNALSTMGEVLTIFSGSYLVRVWSGRRYERIINQ